MTTLRYQILPTRRKASGKLGLYLALTHQKQVRYISTEFEIDDAYQFDSKKWIVYHREANLMNKRMRYVLDEYQEKLDTLPIHRFPTCAALKEALTNDKQVNEHITISELFAERIERLEAENRTSYASMNHYTCNVILSILGDIPIKYITRDTIKMLNRAMLKRQYAPGNIQMRMTHFKAAINEAIDNNLVKYDENPFKSYTMPRSEPRLMDITPEQFTAILNLKTTRQQLILARDIFLLSFYLGGINLADLVKADLSGQTIDYVRQKSSDHKLGNRHTILTIQPEARKIIDKYITPAGTIHIPGVTTNYKDLQRYINKCLALLAEKIGITTSFSYYAARKTFTQFAFTLGVKTEVIEYCIGQSMKSNRPIYNYVRVMQHQADTAIAQVIHLTRNPSNYKALFATI